MAGVAAAAAAVPPVPRLAAVAAAEVYLVCPAQAQAPPGGLPSYSKLVYALVLVQRLGSRCGCSGTLQ